MESLYTIFWISLGILFFCYMGYGMLLFLLNAAGRLFRGRKKPVAEELLPVTLIVAAYNEKDILEEKIHNTLAIDYPSDKLSIIFITDGSTDGSDAIIRNHPSITLMHQQERRGKLAAIKRAIQFVQTPVVVFSDANTILNRECIQKIVTHYTDPNTGGVAGEKKITGHKQVSAVGEAEGLYWKYESFLKKQDAGFYTVVGAAGELFSIRTHLFHAPDDSIILDDFIISMQVCLQGYSIAYEPGAFAVESPSASLREEGKRKLRISAGAYQSIGYLRSCLNFLKYPRLCFQYVSRRLLRWVVCPPMIIVLLLANAWIVAKQEHVGFYTWFLLAQSIFYFLALPGWLLVRSGKKAGIFAIPFYFVFMNYCLVRGFIRFIKGKQTVLWEKSLRQAGVGRMSNR
jgi:biofilm PGA synthesis N-glycosyltransferase PgaC